MRRIFTQFNIVLIILAFCAGTILHKYEEKNGILTVAKPEREELNIKREKTENPDKININTATEEELKTLDGIGDSFAKRIIEYRNINGEFNQIEDLMQISGIGESVFEKIKNDICV